MAVAVVILLVFMLLYSFIGHSGDDTPFQFHKGVKITLGIIIAIASVIAVIWATGSCS